MLHTGLATTLNDVPTWDAATEQFRNPDGFSDERYPSPMTVDFQPGNATRYPIAFTYLGRDVFGCSGRTFLVSRGIDIGGKSSGCYVFGDESGMLAPGYVSEKLNVQSDSCAIVLACVIARVLGRETSVSFGEADQLSIGSCLAWLTENGFIS